MSSLKFQHKNVCLVRHDALNGALFKQPFIDLIVTAPPHEYAHTDYERYMVFSEIWLRNCFAWTKSQGRLCLHAPIDKTKGGAQPLAADLTKIAQKVGWQYKTSIVCSDGNNWHSMARGSWQSASAPVVVAPLDLLLVFYKDDWKKTGGTGVSDISADEFKEWTQGVWALNSESKKQIGHPNPFPKDLAYRCIRLFSYQYDCIFDPFAGSGTTLITAQNTERLSIGIEINETYFELAKDRILRETL